MAAIAETTLPPELIQQVLKLSPESRGEFMDLLFEAMESPPRDTSAVLVENYSALSGDEVDERIRQTLAAARAARRS